MKGGFSEDKIVGILIVSILAGSLLPTAFTYFANISGITAVFFTTVIPIGIAVAVYKYFKS